MKFLFTVILFFCGTMHKYFVSDSDIFYKEDIKQIQIISRLHTHDLELAINSAFNQKISITNENISEKKISELISNYFTENFFFHDLPSKTSFEFVGWENRRDKTLIYVSYTFKKKPKILSWSNGLLIDIFSEQKNIVVFNNKNTKKSFIHTKDKNLAKIVL